MTAKIIKLGARLRPGPTYASAVKRAVRAARPPRPRLPESVRKLRELQHDADAVACWTFWLGQMAARSPDPRALAALADDGWCDDYFDNLDGALDMLRAFAEEWRRRKARGAKPRPVR